MTSNQKDQTNVEDLNRRRLLQGIAATGAATSAAGCLGDGDDGSGDDGSGDGSGDDSSGDDSSGDDGSGDDGPVDGSGDDGTPEPSDTEGIQEGGRLEFAIPRGSFENYDTADSTLADDTTVFNTVYDGLFTQDPSGSRIKMMATRYETTDAQEVSFPDDYTDYMGEYEITAVNEGSPTLNTEWPNLVLPGGEHPDDLAAVGEGELGEGDTMRALSREDAVDAIEDGVYGTKVEGELHEGITFHNGETCTAGNVINSYDRFVGSQNEGQTFNSYLGGVAPDGEDGLTFELYAQEPDAIASTDIIPISIYPDEHLDIKPTALEGNGLNAVSGGEVPVGTGPYQIAEFEQGSQLLLEKYDDYWLEEVGLENKEWFDGDEDFPASPVIEEINIRFVPEDGTRVAALQDGELDIAYELPPGDRTAYDDDENYNVVAALSTGFSYMSFPIADNSVFQHREVREAVNQLLPRQGGVDIIEEGWAAPARAPIPEPAAGKGTTLTYDEFEQQDFAHPVEPNVERAEELMSEAPVEPPVEVIVRTNSDDQPRTDKMQLVVDQLNQTGLFNATLETPGNIGNWFQELIQPDSTQTYGEDNAMAFIGLSSGFDPDGYYRFTCLPPGYNACCNWFHGPGTFDWQEDYNNTRYTVDVAQDPQLRRERFDELWPAITESLGVTIMDYSVDTAVAGPRINGYRGYPGRTGFLSYGLHAPYDEVVTFIDQEE